MPRSAASISFSAIARAAQGFERDMNSATSGSSRYLAAMASYIQSSLTPAMAS